MNFPPSKWLTVDPGEDCGWAVWSGRNLVEAGTDKMWDVGDAVWAAAVNTRYPGHIDNEELLVGQGYMQLARMIEDVELVVVENFTIYPWVAAEGGLDWDEVRTARLIGSIFQACRFAGWQYAQQGAKIKDAAIAAGAEAYFYKPLHENRHANDAIMHGVYRLAKGGAIDPTA